METPVQILIKEFGGVRPLARAVHRDAASVSRWQKGDGLVPTTIQKKVRGQQLIKELRGQNVSSSGGGSR